jgi:hypothetical protein
MDAVDAITLLGNPWIVRLRPACLRPKVESHDIPGVELGHATIGPLCQTQDRNQRLDAAFQGDPF